MNTNALTDVIHEIQRLKIVEECSRQLLKAWDEGHITEQSYYMSQLRAALATEETVET